MKIGILNLEDLDKDYVAIVQLRTQSPGVIHQAALRQDKIHDGLIRLGETPGVDEVSGWQYPQNIAVIAILGTLHKTKDAWECKPI